MPFFFVLEVFPLYKPIDDINDLHSREITNTTQH